jgi:hypothetical protein
LIVKELEILGIPLPNLFTIVPSEETGSPHAQRLEMPPIDQYSTTALPAFQTMGTIGSIDDSVLLDLSYLNGQTDGSMNFDLLNMAPEMYEAFSQVEPLSVIMDPGFDVY